MKRFNPASLAPAGPETASPSPSAPSLAFNTEKSGLELRFPDKPADAVRAGLKAAGFRWSRFSACWYVKDTPEKRAWAENFIANFQSPISQSADESLDESLDEQRPARLDGIQRPCRLVPHPTKPDWFMVIEPGDAQNTVGETLRAAGTRDHCAGWLKKINARFAIPIRTKAAWIRDTGQPAGQPGTGTFACACGQKVSASFRAEDGDVTCAHCGQVYAWDGWLKSAIENRKSKIVIPQIAPLAGCTPLGMLPKSEIPAWRQRFAHR